MTQDEGIAAGLRRLIADDHLSEAALHAITGIEPATLAAFLADASSGLAILSNNQPTLSPDQSQRVSTLAALLVHGLDIDDDQRLQGFVESLTAEFGLTLKNVARLTRLGVADLEIALDDPALLSSESRYRLAVRGSYLISAANQARPG